ncbi:MAG: PCRF domain-containing protein, partial [Ruminococcus sp.]
MVQFEELMLRLENSKSDIDDLADALGLKSMLSEIQQLELRATEPNFWDDIEKSQKVLQKTGALKGIVEEYEKLQSHYEDTHALIELANEEED